MYRSLISVLALGAGANAMNQIIDVGKDGALTFSPNSLTAAVGDTLEFHFYSGSGGHSVASSTFKSPCVPAQGGFFSGYQQADTTGDTTFVVNVTSADPIWFYCSLSSHCQEGMAGVVNPPSGQSITDYTNAAMNVQIRGSAPASMTGGVLTSINEATESAAMTMSVTTGSGGPLQPATTSSVTSTSVRTGVQATPASSTGSGSNPTSTPKNNARRGSDMSVVLGWGVVAGGLAVLMG